MDLIKQVNGMNQFQNWDKDKKRTPKNGNKKFLKHTELIEDNLKDNKLKEYLIEFQDRISNSQNKINLLEITNNELSDISNHLREIRERTLSTINQLDNYKLSKEITDKFKNIDKLEYIQSIFEKILDKNDEHHKEILEEFKHISEQTIRLSKAQDFETDLNNNYQIEKILQDIGNSIDSVASTQKELTKIKDEIISGIKSLNITLGKIVSTYTKIRNIDIATQTIEKAQSQILKNALNSVIIQINSKSNNNIKQLMK